jgi:hypothetical protein
MATQKRTTTTGLLPGHATHTRTQDAYMGALLDAVSLEDWREVVTGAVQLAKGGDPQARAWLGQYLVGRAEAKAPTAINVVVAQLQGRDAVINRLVADIAPSSYDIEFNRVPDTRAQIKEQLQLELSEKLQQASATE